MAFNIYKEYETDQTAEVEGIKYELRDGVHLLLARAGGANIDGRRAIERALSPFKGHGDNPATGKPADSPAGQAALAAVAAGGGDPSPSEAGCYTAAGQGLSVNKPRKKPR